MNKFLLSLALAVGFGSAASAQTYEATPFADLQTGDVVAIVDTNGKYAIPNAKATAKGQVTAETVALSADNNTVTTSDMSPFLFTVTKTADGVTFKSNASTDADPWYLYCIADNNGVRVATTTEGNVFTLDQNFLNTTVTNSKTGALETRYLGVYNKSNWRCYTTIHSNIAATKIAFFKETATASTVYKPTFTPAGGTYYEPQTVNIECSTEGATVEYSLDEKATWTAYTGAITVDKTTTVYARATKDGVTAESSATYEIVTPTKYASFAEMMTMDLPAKGQESEVFTINFDATVVYQSGKYTYLYDGKDYALYYLDNPGLAQYNTLKAGWLAKISNYNNLYEVVPVTTPVKGEDVTTLPTAEVVDASAITAENQAKYVTLKGVELAAATPANAAQFTGTVGGTEVNFYNRFTLPEVAAGTYDVTGFIAVFNTTVQLYPTSFDEPAPTPVEPDYTLVLDWQTEVDTNTGSTAENRFAAANPVTGEILVPNKKTEIIYAITKDGITQKYDASGTALKITTAIGCDTKGNVVLGLGWPNATMSKNLLLISADGSVRNEVDMTTVASDYAGGRVDFFGRILGDVMGEGGLLNVHSPASRAMYALKLVNGAADEVIASLDFDPTGYSNQPNICVPMGATYEDQVALGDEVGDMATPSYLYGRGASMMYYDTEAQAYAKHVIYNDNKPSCYGFDTFFMDGVRYFVQSTGAGNYADGLVIYTIDAEGNNKVVASYDLAAPSLTSSNYVSLNAYPRANGKTVDIYQFTAGKYARHFIFGEQPAAIEVAAPTFDPAAGEVAKGTEVTINCATEGAKLTITINNGDIIVADAPYTFAVNEATTVEAFAFVTSYGATYDSEAVTAEYTVKADAPVTGKEYVLVTTEDNLKENANYVLYGVSTQKFSGVSYTSEAIMSTTINGTDKPVFASIEKGETTFTLENDLLTLSDNVENVALLQLEKSTEAGKWALKLGDKYLQGGHATSNIMGLSDTPYWATITLDANGQVAIVFDKNPEGSTNVNLLYNVNASSNGTNPRFSCYKSTPNAQMAKPYLYLDKVQSGVENVGVDNDDNAPVEYYNLQGIRVNNPGAGQILIRRQGSKVSKVIL